MAWWRACAMGALVVSAACADAPSDNAARSTSGPSTSVTTGAAAPSALAFSAPTVGGDTLDLSSYAGKTVAFWFWAPY